jgi:tetratricopeptide (TPR) repeat protein
LLIIADYGHLIDNGLVGGLVRWILGICVLLISARALWADTIHLKNGASIICDRATDKGDQIEYVIGSTVYYAPRASVSSIERGGGFGVTVGSATVADSARFLASPTANTTTPSPDDSAPRRRRINAPPPPPPNMGSMNTEALMKEILNLGRVDERALDNIEKQRDNYRSAKAYFLAAQYEYEQHQSEAALRYMKHSVDLVPEQAALREWYGVLLLDAGHYPEAVNEAEHAAQLAPESAEAQRILGLAYYDSGQLQEATRSWRRSLDLHPSEEVTQYLAKAQREASVEAGFNELDSAHFVLRYEGRKPAYQLTNDLLRTLDRQFGELSRDLGLAPSAPVSVILYTEQQFFDVTQAPSWAGAINDGKLRIPVRDVAGMTPQMESVLKHELTHSFVYAAAHRCPVWLNEGLAQMEEPRSSAAFAPMLAELYRTGKAPSLHLLEGSFTSLNSNEALLAYAESLAATEYLRSRYGMNGLRRVLELLGQGETPDAALKTVTLGGYVKLDADLANSLTGGAH